MPDTKGQEKQLQDDSKSNVKKVAAIVSVAPATASVATATATLPPPVVSNQEAKNPYPVHPDILVLNENTKGKDHHIGNVGGNLRLLEARIKTLTSNDRLFITGNLLNYYPDFKINLDIILLIQESNKQQQQIFVVRGENERVFLRANHLDPKHSSYGTIYNGQRNLLSNFLRLAGQNNFTAVGDYFVGLPKIIIISGEKPLVITHNYKLNSGQLFRRIADNTPLQQQPYNPKFDGLLLVPLFMGLDNSEFDEEDGESSVNKQLGVLRTNDSRQSFFNLNIADFEKQYFAQVTFCAGQSPQFDYFPTNEKAVKSQRQNARFVQQKQKVEYALQQLYTHINYLRGLNSEQLYNYIVTEWKPSSDKQFMDYLQSCALAIGINNPQLELCIQSCKGKWFAEQKEEEERRRAAEAKWEADRISTIQNSSSQQIDTDILQRQLWRSLYLDTKEKKEKYLKDFKEIYFPWLTPQQKKDFAQYLVTNKDSHLLTDRRHWFGHSIDTDSMVAIFKLLAVLKVSADGTVQFKDEKSQNNGAMQNAVLRP